MADMIECPGCDRRRARSGPLTMRMVDGEALTFALDYDGTYTAAPGLWRAFIATAEALGHTVHIVTARRDDEPVRGLPSGVMVCYTAREAKAPFMRRMGIRVDQWIDDAPEYIHRNHGNLLPPT